MQPVWKCGSLPEIIYTADSGKEFYPLVSCIFVLLTSFSVNDNFIFIYFERHKLCRKLFPKTVQLLPELYPSLADVHFYY